MVGTRSPRHAVVHIEGHYVPGFGDGTGPGDVRPLPGAAEEAETFLADHPETRERYERVVELIEGVETPYGLELLATAHWVATHEDADGLDDGSWLAGALVPAGA